MVAIKGHFDGRVIVPDEPVDLPVNQRLIIHVAADADPLVTRRRSRAREAVAELQRESKAAARDKLTSREIDAEIKRARRERRR